MCGVLHGLHAAHEARSEQGELLEIVHRDVSPHNILVGVDGSARVLDFGVAKARGRSQTTRDGQIKGKIPYMAPEQVRGSVTRQTDIYAAAVVTWEALVGRRLFAGDDELATLAKVVAGEVVAPSQAAPELPKVFDDVVLRGLATAPAERWATAREMALALEKCVGVASPSEVGEWVESTAGHALSQRTVTLNGIESSSFKLPAAAPVPAEAPAPAHSEAPASSGTANVSVRALPDPAPARSRAPYLVAPLLVVIATLVALLLRTRHEGAAALATVSSAPPVTTASVAPASSPAASAPPAPATSPSMDPTAVRPVSAPAVTAGARPTRPVAGPKPSNADCNPPYTTDSQGHRHYKMECL
jgi:serine/threonine-protein kinase